jgi:Signal transduction histidine kinase
MCATPGSKFRQANSQKIFEKFYRVPGIDRWKQGGTGLGLALVQKMTQHLGGKIYVASTANQTCFTVELPIKLSLN